MNTAKKYFFNTAIVLLLSALATSCTSSITTALIGPALKNMQEQSDLLLVCEGTPSYLLMIDSLIAGNPDDETLLILGTKAYSGYMGAMTECGLDQARISAMADKAYVYSSQLLENTVSVTIKDNHDSFDAKLQKSSKGDATALFWAAFGWISWIQQQEGSPNAMAGLGKLEILLLKIIELDDTIESGMPHFLLGGFYGARPGMLGGEPEKSRFHFERALEISQRKVLIYQTIYAETYGRNTLSRDLHDSLLQEVVGFPLESEKTNMLTNQIAKKKAEKLLSERFFDE